ncbi:MAG: hypothetical protein ACYCWN_06965 [Ferrimicrobium sp.]|jgi:hypothetical protein|uniref:Uncharacterized protein n=1 Tax=Ferrimicrobium acidiphilum TaxID=121039 RepID=A0ABV3Y4R4_9ACTN|nr:hypothetical protein [Ferrimicrobium sp.]MCL5973645.1 hypothetical protein [Actinomycetota bacterium]
MPARRAIALEAVVRQERGRWVVAGYVVYESEVVEKTFGSYHTRREAEVAAAWIHRSTNRW